MPERADYDALVSTSKTALTNADTDPELAAVLDGVGYGAEKRAEGMALLDAFRLTLTDHADEYGDEDAATVAAAGAYESARKVYMNHLKWARLVFEGDARRYTALGLHGEREQARAGLLSQARTFYTNLLADADAVQQMDGVKVGEDALEAGQAAMNAVELALAMRTSEYAEAQASTVVRDATATALKKWMRRFLDFGALACEGRPQLKEKLGLVEP